MQDQDWVRLLDLGGVEFEVPIHHHNVDKLCSLRGKIYPFMVHELYMQMQHMSHDANTHTVFVLGVQLEISMDLFANLLGIPWVFESSITLDQVENAPNVGTSGSSASPTGQSDGCRCRLVEWRRDWALGWWPLRALLHSHGEILHPIWDE